MVNYRKPHFTPEEYRQRPKDYDPVLADAILERVSNGETLMDVCRDDRDMPLPGTFLKWCDEDPTLGQGYEKARLRGADVNFDEALEAAHDSDVHRGRVRAEALRWHVERASPNKYSPRAIIKQPGDEKDKGGYDSGADLRRRIEDMAQRAEYASLPAVKSQSEAN